MVQCRAFLEKAFGARSAVDRNGDKAFTATEITRMVNANRESLLGSLVSLVEWQLLLLLAADTEVVEDDKAVPALSVARIKSFYDGTLFTRWPGTAQSVRLAQSPQGSQQGC
ncbi:MAG: hypothetical protein IPI73_05765 [Betaproteobacteria bacterium]|nr:hypothetical protein [Betaproteobacteria bacterium]